MTEVNKAVGLLSCLKSNMATRKMMVLFFLLSAAVLAMIYPQLSWLSVSQRTIKATTNCEDSDPPCLDRLASQFNRLEDIFCINLPRFLPQFKNPCFYDFLNSGKRKLRCLPYFYIIGMAKSGTTDLHARIVKHPLVNQNAGLSRKETQFWSLKRYGFTYKRKGNNKTTLNMYLNMFTQTAEVIDRENNSEIITGDASPMDIWDFRGWTMIPQNGGLNEPHILTPHVLKYIYKRAPKFIIQYREPIERLYSDYIYLGYGKNPLEFHNHTLQAIDMMNDCLRNHSTRFCYFDFDLYHKLPARVHLGCYSVFLKEWFRVFPRSAFHITRTTEYKNDMEGTLKGVFDFLEIPKLTSSQMEDTVNMTKRLVAVNKEGVALTDTVKVLREFYANCNKEMAELLEDDRFLWKDHYL